jgi:HEPN domain-containing protein
LGSRREWRCPNAYGEGISEQHAEECLELAKQAEEFYVRAALIELAAEFKKQAEKIK